MVINSSPYRAINYASYDSPRDLIRWCCPSIVNIVSNSVYNLPYNTIYRTLVVHNTLLSMQIHEFVIKYFR